MNYEKSRVWVSVNVLQGSNNFLWKWLALLALIKPLRMNTPIDAPTTKFTRTQINAQRFTPTHYHHQHITTEAQVGADPDPRTRPPVHSFNPAKRWTSKPQWRQTDGLTHLLPLLLSNSGSGLNLRVLLERCSANKYVLLPWSIQKNYDIIQMWTTVYIIYWRNSSFT